jgi:uncharacterized protein (DUF1330 family)
MSAYIVVDVDIHDPESYERYKSLTPASLVPYEGRFLVRGATTRTLEGDWTPGRFVILEFPDAERAAAWWSSPEYAEAKRLRQASANTKMLLVDGPSFDPRAP